MGCPGKPPAGTQEMKVLPGRASAWEVVRPWGTLGLWSGQGARAHHLLPASWALQTPASLREAHLYFPNKDLRSSELSHV